MCHFSCPYKIFTFSTRRSSIGCSFFECYYDIPREQSIILTQILLVVGFFGPFEKFQKANISFVMYVHLSVRPHGTVRFSIDEFLLNLTFGYFFENMST